jgi:type I restriction enzyme M protein
MTQAPPDQLDATLKELAWMLRDSAHPMDALETLFTLLLLKRASDAANETRGSTCWNTPRPAQWKHLRESRHTAEALNSACGALEAANPFLEGVLRDLDFHRLRAFDSVSEQQLVLNRALSVLDRCSLSQQDVPDEVLGRACTHLLDEWAASARLPRELRLAPWNIVRLLVELMEPQPGMSVCDPVCAFGTTLTECARYIAGRQGQGLAGVDSPLRLEGQERSTSLWRICRLNLLLHGLRDVRIALGDVLREPMLREGGALSRYDRVIAHTPFSPRWAADYAEADPDHRFRFGVPPRNQGDFAFIQHVLSALRPRGRAAVLAFPAVLFRGGADSRIRQGILEANLLEAVILLPENALFTIGVASTVLLFNADVTRETRGEILFVDASKEGTRDGTRSHRRSVLQEQHLAHITSTVRKRHVEPGFSRRVPLEEVAANGFDLQLRRYITSPEEEEELARPNLAQLAAELAECEHARDSAAARMDELLGRLRLKD